MWRLISQKSRLYTEMVTCGALIHGDKKRFLDYNHEEHPIALQVGGSEPADLAKCAELAGRWAYDEINLNCGCPSDRVQSGKIGAILMAEPDTVARCVEAMVKACSIPVTVKHRIGIDDMDDYKDMRDFVSMVSDAGAETFIVHARKAWLKGLSPKENREIPPLKYEMVYRLKEEFPHLNIVINGGITTLEQTASLLEKIDGVMIGREAYSNPYFLSEVDAKVFGMNSTPLSRNDIATHYLEYCEKQLVEGTRLHHLSRHILGLYQGQPRARLFRRHISENAPKPEAKADVIRQALAIVEQHPTSP